MSANITDRAAQVLREIDAALALAEKATQGRSLQIIRDDIKAWLELRDSLKVGRDDVSTWDFCQRRITAICDQWRAEQ